MMSGAGLGSHYSSRERTTLLCGWILTDDAFNVVVYDRVVHRAPLLLTSTVRSLVVSFQRTVALADVRRSTREVYHTIPEAPHIMSSIPHQNADFSKNQTASR